MAQISRYSDSLRTVLSRNVLGPTQPPVQWVTCLCPGGKGEGFGSVYHPPPSSADVKERVELYLYPPLWAYVACSAINFSFLPHVRTRVRNDLQLTHSCCLKNRNTMETLYSFPTVHRKRFLPYTGCPRRNGQNFGRVFLMLNYTDITQNTYIQRWTVTEIMAREVWNFDSCYSLIDYQIHIKTGRNMWFL